MILSNIDIIAAIKEKRIIIDPHPCQDPSRKPYSTMAIDFHLDNQIRLPRGLPAAIDLTREEQSISELIKDNSSSLTITNDQPFRLQRNCFILAQTIEKISLPHDVYPCLSARVEGKSSIARCGLLIHFTSPTIHNGYYGTITLEIINHGPNVFLLTPGMPICQLIFEEIKGNVAPTGGRFIGQCSPEGPGRDSASEQELMAIASMPSRKIESNTK